MKNFKIYLALVLLCIIFNMVKKTGYLKLNRDSVEPSELQSKLSPVHSFINSTQAAKLYNEPQKRTEPNTSQCTMRTCFNLTRCTWDKPFKVYIPSSLTNHTLNSGIYKRILSLIKNSKYNTDRQDDACLYLLPVDTLDRDHLSMNYARNLSWHIEQLNQTWSNGTNYLVLNLYAGSWPNYTTSELNFMKNKSILAQASIEHSHYQQNFDISFPLFHSNLEASDVHNQIDARKYLLTFKGKRYLFGPSSQLRNTIYHLHNNRDIIMLTTCNHTANLYSIKDDERCASDESNYNKYVPILFGLYSGLSLFFLQPIKVWLRWSFEKFNILSYTKRTSISYIQVCISRFCSDALYLLFHVTWNISVDSKSIVDT